MRIILPNFFLAVFRGLRFNNAILVYCFEGVDNAGEVFDLVIPRNAKITLERAKDKNLGGVRGLVVDAVRVMDAANEGLYSSEKPEIVKCKARAIPYFTWCNRGENQMRVWMPWC